MRSQADHTQSKTDRSERFGRYGQRSLSQKASVLGDSAQGTLAFYPGNIGVEAK